MIIDHNYAQLFEFRYSLILDAKNMGDVDEENILEMQESAREDRKFELEKFISAEDTKTLFLIHYPFIDK